MTKIKKKKKHKILKDWENSGHENNIKRKHEYTTIEPIQKMLIKNSTIQKQLYRKPCWIRSKCAASGLWGCSSESTYWGTSWGKRCRR